MDGFDDARRGSSLAYTNVTLGLGANLTEKAVDTATESPRLGGRFRGGFDFAHPKRCDFGY